MSSSSSSAAPADWGNPLRDKLDKRLPRIAGPCAVVIFGVTGDLATKKLMPAIYDLANRGLLPPTFSLIGFGRRDWQDDAAWWCSELIPWAAKQAGTDLFRPDALRRITPEHLWMLPAP